MGKELDSLARKKPSIEVQGAVTLAAERQMQLPQAVWPLQVLDLEELIFSMAEDEDESGPRGKMVLVAPGSKLPPGGEQIRPHYLQLA